MSDKKTVSTAELDRPHLPDSRQAANLLTELEQRLTQLRHWQQESDAHVAALQEQGRQLDEERAQLQQQAEQLAEQARQLDEARTDIASERQSLEGHRERIESRQKQLEQQQKDFARQTRELEEESHLLEDARAALAEEQEQFTAQIKSLEEQSADLAAQRDALTQQEQSLAEAREQLAAQHRDLAQQQQEFEARVAELNAQREALSQQQRELAESREQLAAEQQTLQQQRDSMAEERERLAADIDKLKADRKRYEQKRMEQKLQTEALEAQQRQLEEARQDLATQLAEQFSPGDSAILPVPTNEETERLRAELKSRAQQFESREKELESRLAELQKQMEQLSSSHQDLVHREQTLAQRVKTLDDREAELAEREASLQRESTSGDALAVRRAELEKREAELDRKLRDYRETLEKSKNHLLAERDHLREKEAKVDAHSAELREKLNHAKQLEQRYARRRAKLHRYKRALQDRAQKQSGQTQRGLAADKDAAALEQQRQMLQEVKTFLESSEAEMVRRWATHKSASLVLGGMVCLMFLAMMSYFIGYRMTTPLRQATVTLNIDADGQTATGAAFVNEQRQHLFSDEVLREAMSQFAQRGLRPYADIAAMRSDLSAQLTVSSSAPRELVLTYPHQDAQLARTTLDVLSKSYIAFTQHHAAQGEPMARARLTLEAGVDPKPIHDSRWKVASSTFGAVVALAIAGMALLRWRLSQANRVLIPEADQLAFLSDNAD